MLIRFLLGFASAGLFVVLAMLGLEFDVFGFDFPSFATIDWLLVGGWALGAGVVGGGVAAFRGWLEDRRPLLGQTIGERSRRSELSIWDFFPW